MNKVKKAQWVAALRSGKYQQARGILCSVRFSKRSYCCLGVLSDLAVADGVGQWLKLDPEYLSYSIDGTESNSVSGYYADTIQVWAGTRNEFSDDEAETAISFSYIKDGERLRQAESLADLNDGGFTFDQIADLIDYFL